MEALARKVHRSENSVPVDLAPLQRRVDKLLEERKLTTRWLYERVGMSKQGWSDMWRNGSMKVQVLQRVSEVLKVPVAELMGEQPAGALAEPAAAYGRPKYLEERVAELEAAVKQLRHDLRRKG